MPRTIVTTDKVDNPHEIALYASAVLAADKGIPLLSNILIMILMTL